MRECKIEFSDFRRSLTVYSVLLTLVLTGAALACFQVRAIAVVPSPFHDFCGNSVVGPDIKKTLDILLEKAGTKDCIEAEMRLQRLVDLDLSSREIHSLEPLAGFHRLRYLNLASNRIDDLTPLSGLKKLEILDLGYNLVSNLSPIAGLVRLRSLHVNQNRIQSLVSTGHLRNLEELFINENQVRDLSPLRALPKLRILWAFINPLDDKSCPLQRPEVCGIDEAQCQAELKPEQHLYSGWISSGTRAAVIKTGWSPQAPKSCVTKGYPILAASCDAAAAWIQVIEVTVPDPKTGKTPWMFVDTGSEARNKGEPFYKQGSSWEDSPSWGINSKELKTLPNRRRDWRGYLFPVRVEGKRVIPLGGVSWGYSWVYGKPEPQAISPVILKPEDWEKRREFLKRERPDFEYVNAQEHGDVQR